jgi:hypothetical protein
LTINLWEVKSPVTVRLSLIVPKDMDYLEVEDTPPAGVKMINPNTQALK